MEYRSETRSMRGWGTNSLIMMNVMVNPSFWSKENVGSIHWVKHDGNFSQTGIGRAGIGRVVVLDVWKISRDSKRQASSSAILWFSFRPTLFCYTASFTVHLICHLLQTSFTTCSMRHERSMYLASSPRSHLPSNQGLKAEAEAEAEAFVCVSHF